MNSEEAMKKAYESILSHDFEQAVRWFEQAIALNPEQAVYHYKLSITYARSNKLEAAIRHAKLAVQLEPDDEHYVFHLQHLEAKTLITQAEKWFEEPGERLWMAVTMLKRAVELDPLSLEGFLLLGLAYSRLEEYGSASQAIGELLKLDPDHAIGKRLYADYRQKTKQYMQSAFPTGIRAHQNGETQ